MNFSKNLNLSKKLNFSKNLYFSKILNFSKFLNDTWQTDENFGTAHSCDDSVDLNLVVEDTPHQEVPECEDVIVNIKDNAWETRENNVSEMDASVTISDISTDVEVVQNDMARNMDDNL